jgi:hypothetical protein
MDLDTKKNRDDLLKALNRIRRYLCAYCPPDHVNREESSSDRFCDCKYGADNLGRGHESGNGCPEMRLAMDIIQEHFKTNKQKRKRKPKWVTSDE